MPQQVVKAEGSTLTLPCESAGDPVPRITWGRAGGAENFTDDEQLSELVSLESSMELIDSAIDSQQRSYK